MRGIVVNYYPEKGFGFVKCEGEEKDVFLHRTDLPKGAIVKRGTMVEFEVTESKKGPRATSVTVLGQSANGVLSHGAFFVLGAILGALLLSQFGGLPPLLAWITAANFSALGACAYDKSIAGTAKLRVPETVLYLLAFIGGTVGLLFGMTVFRHKTLKRSFQFGLGLVLALQIVLIKYTGLYEKLMPQVTERIAGGAKR